jgi:F0F1-type ATP synthase assembly protein I
MTPDHRGSGVPSALSGAGLAGMGLEFVIAILVCLFAGHWLDGRLKTTPLFMIVGVFLGAGVFTFAMYRRVFPPDKPAPPKSDER